MRDLLSATFGVPLTLIVMGLLFAIDVRQVTGARRSAPLLVAASVGFLAVLVLVISRFAEYA